MAEFPALPLWTDAYLADTIHLSTLEHGAYLRLLMIAWRMPGCSLPNDDARLAKFTGLDLRTWNRIKSTIMAFWVLDNGLWMQKRLTKERDYLASNSCKRAEAGRVGGLASASRKSMKNNNQAQANVKQPLSNRQAPTPTPTPIREISIDISPETGFENFWAEYPLKKSKGSARKAYIAAMKKGISDGELIEAARKYRSSVAGKDQKYTAHAATWLNAERWTDEYPSQPDFLGSHDGNRAREALAKRFGGMGNQRAAGISDDIAGNSGGPIIDHAPANARDET